MPNVKFDDLQPGDLLFQYAGDPYSNEFEHVVMYVGPQQGNKHLVVSHAMYESNATKTMKKNVVGLSRLPEYNYLVIRCNDRDLAERACQQALRWSKFEVPYDEKRKDGLFRRKEDAYIIESPNQMDSGIVTNHWAGSGFVNNAGEVAWKRGEHLGHHDFLAGTIYQEELVAVDRGYMKHSPVYSAANQEGILRMIKYAARQNTFPTFPNPKDNVPSDRQYERGFNCSFFSTLCYQVAACERVDLVKPLGEGEWVFNKHETTKTGHATHGALHYFIALAMTGLAKVCHSSPRSIYYEAQ